MNTPHPMSAIAQREAYGTRPQRPGLYLGLMHGRTQPRQRMDNWGFDGPAIGPLRWCHTTYAFDIKIKFVNTADAALYFDANFDGSLPMQDDMVVYEGNYYGDWTVYYVGPDECANPQDTFRST